MCIRDRVWVLGFGLMLLYALGSLLALRQRLADATLLGKGIKGSQWVSSPFVMGLFRPTIYLPYHLDEDCQKYVLAHENAHIRRRDHWLKPMAFLLLSVYWSVSYTHLDVYKRQMRGHISLWALPRWASPFSWPSLPIM